MSESPAFSDYEVNLAAQIPSSAPLFRDDFPVLARSTYLNAAGMGLVPRPVQNRVASFVARIGDEGSQAFFDSYDEIMIAPRRAAARLFGADLRNVAIVNSASEAISQFAAWRQPQQHENVVVIDIDHPTTSFPWMRQAEQTGSEIRFAKVAHDPASLSFDSIARLVDARTAVISLSHVQWVTGYRFDLAALAELAHAHGAHLVVDATHSAGIIPIDAPACGVDLLVTGSFKWLLSYSGTGACYLRSDVLDRFRPVMVGSRTAQLEGGQPGAAISSFSLPNDATRLEYGSSAHLLRLGYAASIEYLLAAGIERVASHVQSLGDELIDGIQTLGGTVLTPIDRSSRAGIVTVAFRGRDPRELTAALLERNVVAMQRMEAVRFSPHGYNHSADIQACLAALEAALPSC